VTCDELIARALAFADATEDYPFGEDLLTVKVGGKVFAWIPLGDAGWLGQGPRMAVKLPADLVTELRHTYPGQVGPARPLDERYWVHDPSCREHPRQRDLRTACAVLPRGCRPPAPKSPSTSVAQLIRRPQLAFCGGQGYGRLGRGLSSAKQRKEMPHRIKLTITRRVRPRARRPARITAWR
jgi:predicted DNA-binding protein (MmcQ/YjbR family)